jgi:hypothetical protein
MVAISLYNCKTKHGMNLKYQYGISRHCHVLCELLKDLYCFVWKKTLNREKFVSRCIKEKLQACRTDTVTVRNKGFWIVVQHGSQVSGCNAFCFNYPKITSYVANFSCTLSFSWHRIEVGISQYLGGHAYNEGYCFCQECTCIHVSVGAFALKSDNTYKGRYIVILLWKK